MITDSQTDDAQLGITVRQIAVMMQDSPKWEPHVLQHYQRLQLGQLLLHAKQHVPFYKERLDCLFTADGSINWSRWQDIPILKRADLRDSADALLASVVPPLHGPLRQASSSGSTGIPVTTTFPLLFTHVANVAWKRFYEFHAVDLGHGYTDFRNTLPAGSAPDAESYNETIGENVFIILRNLPLEQKLNYLRESPFKVLRDMPNHAELLARANLRLKQPVKLDCIIGIGMAMSDEQRNLFQDSFGAKSIMPYSSKEGSLIAYQCPHGLDHYHNCAELMLLEVVDEFGKAVAPGIEGRCIITPFFNSAQPLIRYEQGDLIVQGTHCLGGITLPVIKQVSGRQDSIFRFPGRDVAIIGLDVVEIRQLLNADAFQLAQTDAEVIEVRYVAQIDLTSLAATKMTNNIRKIIGFPLTVIFRRMPDIPYNSGGKQQRFVREYEPAP